MAPVGSSGAISWDPAAERALKRVPSLVRPLVRRKVAERVANSGRRQVSLADFEQAEARFKALRGGRSDQELAGLLPVANRPGAPLLVLEACRAQLSGCPNVILDTGPWQEALEQWLAQADISERLRRRVDGDQVLFHHKLKIALAGCPNGCSRPQIADLALVGAAQPSFDAQACTACGQCAQACPDEAIEIAETALWQPQRCLGCLQCSSVCPAGAVNLSPPRARVLMGGKLGRHPQLAREVALVAQPAQAVELFSRAVEQYLTEAPAEERFAAWWQRNHREDS
ncbi:MAG: 4Fe-4S dicluster domain-containing protein [Desulfarculus sp.]|nr:MAG: 4Fe-4S dicluster domain-containing protein [Desulfarculus sp.]